VTDYFANIVENESLRLDEFPVARDQVYLAHAGICPLPRCVAKAISDYVQASQSHDQETAAGDLIEKTRASLADFLAVHPDEVCLLGSTSNALSVVAAGFPFQAGDNVVYYGDDYPSNVYPWLALQEREVEARSLEMSRLAVINVDDVLRRVDGRTRLVSLASCHYLSGFRLDLDEIGFALRERGIAFCVDGIQSVGAFHTELSHVDFMAADSHKWMLGPCSAGVLYVRREWQDRLRPSSWGWNNISCPNFIAKDRLEFSSTARRYEPGTANLVGLAGLVRAVALLKSVGLPQISQRLLRMRASLSDRVGAAGYQVIEPGIPEERSGGMLSFTRKESDLNVVMERFADRSVKASLRQVRDGRQCIRFSPHFYNTDAELELAVECL
jgi:cysteine desulfurase / selenocysteine lyase